MLNLMVCQTDKGRWAVRPLNAAGIWKDNKISETECKHIAIFESEEEARIYANTAKLVQETMEKMSKTISLEELDTLYLYLKQRISIFANQVAIINDYDKEYAFPLNIEEKISFLHIDPEEKLLTIGDYLYVIDIDEAIGNYTIYPYRIDGIEQTKEGFFYKTNHPNCFEHIICEFKNVDKDIPYLNYYRVFSTEEKAKTFQQELIAEREIERE